MKKFISLLTVLMLCAALMVPAYAANEFKPSVEFKPAPEIVPIPDGEGNMALAMLVDEFGVVVDYIYEGDMCLVVTPVARAEDSNVIPEDAKNTLLDCYEKLNNGSMTLPYEKFDAGLVGSNMVIRDLFDISFLCDEHPSMLIPEGVRLVVRFRMGVDADKNVYTMTFNDGEWNPIVSTVNNNDGTITCTFEHLCPVAFTVEGEQSEPPQSGDPAGEQLGLWLAVCGVAVLAVAVLTFFYIRNNKKCNQ
jgi:hypothetical protein